MDAETGRTMESRAGDTERGDLGERVTHRAAQTEVDMLREDGIDGVDA